MSRPIRPRLTHMGLYVHDLPMMVSFYTSVLGLIITDRGHGKAMPVELVFMSNESDKHHQVVLASGRPADAAFSTINQLSFSIDSLDELRVIKARAEAAGASAMRALNHGNAWSIYFKDPEGNTIEVYLDSPFYVPQPHGDPLDLSQSDADILAQTEAVCRADPGFLPRADWERAMAQRLGAAE